jgi:hypothetical protein
MKSMSEERSNHLIKCAARIAELMNVGVHPDAALLKVARDEALNAEEVKRVSEATNNAKTISVLAGSKPSEKSAPFPLTNAEAVNDELWSKNPDAEHEVTPDTAGNFDASKMKSKKSAAAESLATSGSYLDVEAPDYAAALREACGFDTHTHSRQKIAVDTTLDADVVLRVENEHSGAKIATAGSRMVSNPFAALAGARHQCEDARAKYAEDADRASAMVTDVADAFRRADAPTFARVEKIAQHMGVPSQILDVAYELGNLEKIGHARADAGMKLADEWDIAQCTSTEKHLAEQLVNATAMAKQASDAYAVYLRLDAGLTKVAGELNEAIKHVSSEVEAMPDRLSGAGFDHSKAVDLIGNATGTLGDKPELPKGDQSPLDVNTRQELANNDTAIDVQKLMGDSFIGAHPLHTVVDAFNRIRSVNPGLSDAELNSLIRHDLSTEGAVPFDTLHRARQHSPK